MDDRIAAAARAIGSLAPVIPRLEKMEAELSDVRRAAARGHFRPDEEDRLRAWFARYLTVRAGLFETIDDLRPLAGARGSGGGTGGAGATDADTPFRAFVIVYTAACLLVRNGRLLVDEVATDKVIQRKLNEAVPCYRIPARQYTVVYRSLTRPWNAWRLQQAMFFADANRAQIEALAADPVLGPVVATLGAVEEALAVSVRSYVKARLRFQWHSWRRRRATAVQRAMFEVMKGSGRVIAEMRNPFHRDRVRARHRAKLASLLRPGDIIVSRHDQALSNLFLPGYWPHAALHIGPAATRGAMSLAVTASTAERWADPVRVLEARKDGVRLRALDDTLAVDSFAVIRPGLGEREIASALENALSHEGKLYNFDFDFFTDDRLVCTEVVYRAYEGVGDIAFELRERAGRLTLSAEDVLDMAVERRGFHAVAVFGTPDLGNRLVTGSAAAQALERSYRPDR